MLKRLNGRHLGVIRRLIVGQTHAEIERDLGISQSRISVLLDDPLFWAKYTEIQEQTMSGFLEVRANAMEILQEAAPDAARIVVEAFRKGTVNGKGVGPGLQLNSAFDVLDRTGNKAVERSIVGSFDLGQLIADAYVEKHGSSAFSASKEDKPDSPFNLVNVTPVKDDNGGNETKEGDT